MKKILECLNKSDEELTPKEIAFRTKLKHSTVRVYLRKLLKEGKVLRVFYGHYKPVKETTHGVEELPKIHNIILSIPYPKSLNVSSDIEEREFSGIKFRIIFGSKNKKITCFISSKIPLSYREFDLCIFNVRKLIGEKTGYTPSIDSIIVKSLELNYDFSDLRLDGIKCLTLRTFNGILERIYNKNDYVRNEVKIKDQNIQSIYTLMKGGVTSYNLVQGQFMIVQKLERLVGAIKFSNSLTYKAVELFKEILKRLPK